MKDNNGSTFRCVALSFLMDAMKPSENPEILPGTKRLFMVFMALLYNVFCTNNILLCLIVTNECH